MRIPFAAKISPIILVLIAGLQIAAGGSSDSDKKDKPSVSIDQVQALIDATKYSDAVKKGRELISFDKNPQAYTLVGFALRKQKKWDEAIKSYRDALELDGSYSPAKEYLAVAYLNKKDNAKAKDLYEDLKRTDPHYAKMLQGEAKKMGVNW